MAVDEFTTNEEIENVLSIAGADSSANDEDGSDTNTHMDAAKRWAKNTTKFWLGRRYADTQMIGNSWILEACGILAAHQLCRRRGNPIPASLQSWYADKLEEYKMIKAGNSDIPDATERFQKNAPGMSNMTVDLQRGIAKLRAQDRISTGRSASALPRDTDTANDNRIDDY